MCKFRGKEFDIYAYLSSPEIQTQTFDLCQELSRLSDEAICQLWKVLEAKGTVGTMIDEAFWDGHHQGQSKSLSTADALAACSDEMLIEELQRRLKDATER